MNLEPVYADPLSDHMGITLIRVEPGYAEAIMMVKPELLNAHGTTHGGSVFALADVVFSAASNSHGPIALALDVHISFVKATQAGDSLRAVAREENLSKRTGLYRMEITDSCNELVAIAEGRVLRKT